jgi:hypothetical protein
VWCTECHLRACTSLLLYSTRVTDGAGESENEASSSICKAHIGQILGQPENEQAAMPDSTIEQDDGGRCACLSGRLYLPLEALGVDAEGRLGVFPGREPRELLRRAAASSWPAAAAAMRHARMRRREMCDCMLRVGWFGGAVLRWGSRDWHGRGSGRRRGEGSGWW